MDHVTPRLLAVWLVGALALSLAVVGCGTITSQDPPLNRAGSLTSMRVGERLGVLTPCTMSNGDAGLKFDDLCLPAPPAGWTGVARRILVQPASFLTLPDTRECRSSILGSETLQV